MQICSIEKCGRPHKARGYCQTHYMQFRRGVPVVTEIRTRDKTPLECCSENGCDEPVKAKGLCKMHYQRLLRHGYTKQRDRTKPIKQCTIEGCNNHLYSNGLCNQHYIKDRKWKKFGVTVQKYIEMFNQQNGLCQICNQPEKAPDPLSGKTKDLAVDHCHSTNRIRGLLCSNCNRGLGLFCDDPNLIRKAAEYLEKAPS